MHSLNDLQLASLLEEIAAAMSVDKPIADAMNRLKGRRLGRVATAAAEVASRLERGKQPSDAIRLNDSLAMNQASAALAASQRSGDASTLSQFADQLRLRHQHSRLFRLSWLYPTLLLFVAYAVGVIVMAPVIRSNHGAEVKWSPWVHDLSQWLAHSWWIPPLIAAVALCCLVLFMISKQRMPRDVRMMLFCGSLANQIEQGVPESDAIKTAALMAGESDLAEEPGLSFQSPNVKALLSENQIALPDSVNTKDMLVASLRYQSAMHHEGSRSHDYLWGQLLPRVVMVLIGGGMTIGYAWWVIRPIYQQVAQW